MLLVSYNVDMYKRDARFYFANLGVDVGRCASALLKGDLERYRDHLAEAHRTLEYLKNSGRPDPHENPDPALARYKETNDWLKRNGLDPILSETEPPTMRWYQLHQ